MNLIFTYPNSSTVTVPLGQDFDRVTERYELVAEEIEVEQSKTIRQINYGSRWFAKYQRSHADGDANVYNILKTHFSKSVKVEAESCKHLDGSRFEVILFNASWDWNGQWQNVIHEESFAFELKSAALLAVFTEPKTISIVMGSETMILSGVELEESLEETKVTATLTTGVEKEKVKWTKAILKVSMPETEGTYPAIVRKIMRRRLEGVAMKIHADFTEFLKTTNDKGVVFSEAPVYTSRYRYDISLRTYELVFKTDPLTAEQLWSV